MRLQSLSIKNFRNHANTQITLSPGVNFFLGGNGEGKTNILEGISYLCLSKSLFSISDELVVKIGNQDFNAIGEIVTDQGIGYEIQISFDKGQKQKTAKVNNRKIDRLSSMIGQFPVVVLSPDQNTLTVGPSIGRRKFVDFVISQVSRSYLETLIEYRQVLRQRNKILTETGMSDKEKSEMLDPWNKNLIVIGTEIVRKRMEFVTSFQTIFTETYTQVAGIFEKPSMSYEPAIKFINNSNENSIENAFARALKERYADEIRKGFSLIGPHRDEFVFKINNLNVREYASQGQHKTVLIALKLSEFYYIKEQCRETPILLLDNIFSELDVSRVRCLLEKTSNLGQLFITATDERMFSWVLPSMSAVKKFFIRNGSIERTEEKTPIN